MSGMRAARDHDHGDPDVSTVEEVSRPGPGRGEVLGEEGWVAVTPD